MRYPCSKPVAIYIGHGLQVILIVQSIELFINYDMVSI